MHTHSDCLCDAVSDSLDPPAKLTRALWNPCSFLTDWGLRYVQVVSAHKLHRPGHVHHQRQPEHPDEPRLERTRGTHKVCGFYKLAAVCHSGTFWRIAGVFCLTELASTEFDLGLCRALLWSICSSTKVSFWVAHAGPGGPTCHVCGCRTRENQHLGVETRYKELKGSGCGLTGLKPARFFERNIEIVLLGVSMCLVPRTIEPGRTQTHPSGGNLVCCSSVDTIPPQQDHTAINSVFASSESRHFAELLYSDHFLVTVETCR